jgi:Leucine-rich repeat (LRR) protein
MGNSIGKEMLSKLQEIMRSKPNLTSLCGIAGGATEADLSGLGMDANDASILASELPDKGALTQFDISSNNIRAEGGKVLAEALKGNRVLTAINISSNSLAYKAKGSWTGDMSGIIAIADAISDMRALTTLDMSNNSIVTATYIKAPRKGIKIGELIDGNPVIEKEDSDGEVRIRQLDGIRAIASAIPDMGALTSLNLSSNNLSIEGAKIIADILPKCT